MISNIINSVKSNINWIKRDIATYEERIKQLNETIAREKQKLIDQEETLVRLKTL